MRMSTGHKAMLSSTNRAPAYAAGTCSCSRWAAFLRQRVDGKQVEGIDKLTFDEDGLITELKVMIRPASALQAVAQRADGRRV
jgi:hypothetical protein